MVVDPQLLRTFLVVAQAGSISAAARALHRSQPAVTTAVQRLEERFGEPLFDRGSRGVRLTGLGERLLPHAAALQRVLAGVEELLLEAQLLEGGRLRIAASTTIALYWLPPRLASFNAAHPSVQLIVHTRNSQEALVELTSGDADLALVEAPSSTWSQLPRDLLSATTVHRDELVVIVNPSHPFARRSKLLPTDLDRLPFVGRERGSGTRDVLEQALRDVKAVPDVRLELGEPEAIKRAVAAGLGAAVLSRVAVEEEVRRGTLVALTVEHPGFAREFTLLHPTQELASRAAWAFMSVATAAN